MFKEHLVFIYVPIALASISSYVIDQHPIVTLDNELIEELDPKAPYLVMDIPLRRSKECVGPQYQMTTLSTYKSMSMMWVTYQI